MIRKTFYDNAAEVVSVCVGGRLSTVFGAKHVGQNSDFSTQYMRGTGETMQPHIAETSGFSREVKLPEL